MSELPQESPPAQRSRYKYQRLRERLRLAINERQLSGKLPGERELARRFDANAKTINKALSDLAAEGLLVRHVGRGTFVAGHDGSSGGWAGKSLRVGWWGDGSNGGSRDNELQQLVSELLAARGHRLECLSPDDTAGDRDSAVLKPARLREIDGVVFCVRPPHTGMLADLHRRHVPVVLACTLHDSIRMPSVVADYTQGAFELSQHLLHLGHRRIRLVVGEERAGFTAGAFAGYQAAMRRHGIEPAPPIPARGPLEPGALTSGGQMSTAVVMVGAATALESVRRLRSSGLEIPEALSIAVVGDPCSSELRSASITAYETDPACVARWVAELLVGWSPGQTSRTVIVPGQIHCRGSVLPLEPTTPLAPPREAVLES